MEELIAKRYAKALSAASKEIEKTAKVLTVLGEAIGTESIDTVLRSPVVKESQKTEMVLAALGKEADDTLVNFVRVLGEKKRLALIPVIARVLNAELQKASNKFEGEVLSAEPLDKKELQKLEKALKKYSGAEITLKRKEARVDGIKVSVEDLGIEVNFSKERVKQQLIEHIKRAF